MTCKYCKNQTATYCPHCQPTPESKEDWEKEFEEIYSFPNTERPFEIVRRELLNFIRSEKKKSEEGCEYCAWKAEPMGVSQWKNVGIKYGYWKYFESQAKEEMRKEILELINRKRPFNSLKEDLINYLK